MKRLLLTILLVCGSCVSRAQGFYGDVIFSENFDAPTALNQWTEKNETSPGVSGDTIKWQIANPSSNQFTYVDPSSKTSAYIRLEEKNKPMISLTKEVSFSNKSDIALGFYGKSLNSLSNGLNLKLRISKDNGNTWVLLFNSSSDAGKGESITKGWSFYKFFLAAEYDGLSSVKIQFQIDGTNYAGYGNDIFIDNFFVSERYKVDYIATSINYGDEDIPSRNAYSASEPITIEFKNGGKDAISSILLHYQINSGNIVTETYTPATPIQKEQTGEYTFTQKADFSAAKQTFAIKVWLDLQGDKDTNNNTIFGSAENIITNVPYIPAFRVWDEDDEMWYLTGDDWRSKNMSTGGEGGSWKIDELFEVANWYIINKNVNTNAYLISRPIYFESGKTYELKFDALTNLTTKADPNKLNKMTLYIDEDTDFEGMTQLYSNTSIDEKNALNIFARYTPTKTGPQYFIFHCTSPSTADKFMIQNISVLEPKAIDCGISELLSPKPDTYEFITSESVSVKIRNFGTSEIAKNTISVKMQLNEGTIISETVASSIAPATELVHNFTTKIDPSDQNKSQILKVWTELTNDKNKENDSTEYLLKSIVTGIPYTPTEEKDFRFNWQTVDNNQDGYTFYIKEESGLGWAFSYGGQTGINGYIIEKSNEALFSRPVRLSNGSTYRMTYKAMVGKTAMPLRIDLYKMNGETKILIKTISTINVNNTKYEEKEALFEITADGVYKLAFVVEHEIALQYKINLGNFNLTKMADCDLIAKKSTFFATEISCYNNPQIGILIKNGGGKKVSNFKLKAESTSIGVIEQEVNTELMIGESRLFFFDDRMVFNGSKNEDLTLSVLVDNDANLYDNSIVSTINYVNAVDANTRYTGKFYMASDMIAINHNKDAYGLEVDALSQARGIKYVGDTNVNANDELISRCLQLKKEDVYSLDFNYMVDNIGDNAQLRILAINRESSDSIEITDLKNINKNKSTKFSGCFKVPSDGDYSIHFQVYGNTKSLRLINTFSVEKTDDMPDIQVLSIEIPKDTIFSKKESIAVKFKSADKFRLSSIPFVLDVNGMKYYTMYSSVVAPEFEAAVTFDSVDLFAPGDYTLTVTANVAADLTIENNTITKTIKSLPIVDLKIVSLDKPKSGSLSAEQQIMLTVKNNGKGALNTIPISCTIDDKTILTGTIEGPLEDNETFQYTFPKTADMHKEKTYTLSVSAILAGDINILDNTLSTSVVCTQVPFDAGVTDILSPTNGVLTTTENVKIKVKNYCTVDLFDVPVQLSVGTQKITGSVPKIAIGKDAEYTFTQTIDMSTYGMYTLTASTMIEEDAVKSNDEFTKEIKSYKIDVGIIEILSPVSSANMDYEDVKVLIKNFGDAPVSNIPVRYRVSTLPQMGTFTNEIAPGATAEFTFPSPYNFSAEKTYTLVAYTEYSKDMDHTNDTISTEVTNTKLSIDAELKTLLTPVSGKLSKEETVTVVVRNAGQLELKNMPIECDIDGIIATETIKSILSTGAETTYSFIQKFDMSLNKKYKVKVSLKVPEDNNKTNDVIESIIDGTVSLEDSKNTLNLSFYPNPVRDILNIEGEYNSLEIFNLAGKLILTANGQKRISVSDFPSGVYIIKACGDNKIGRYKMVK